MGTCSFVYLRKLEFCAHYSKGDFTKPEKNPTDLTSSCLQQWSQLPLYVHICAVLFRGENGHDKVYLGCVLWKRDIWSMPVLLGRCTRLSGSTRSCF